MIHIVVAFYMEGASLIRRLSLKKDEMRFPFPHYRNQEKTISLTVTGVGEVAAATAVGAVCGRYGITEEDFLLNIGTCAGIAPQGDCFLINKMTEQMTGRTFYPDILYEHPFEEAEAATSAKVVEHVASDEKMLYDMEAAAIYQAGAHFFGPHQMQFIKICSDAGAQGASAEWIHSLTEKNLDRIVSYIDRLQNISENARTAKEKEKQEVSETQQLCRDLCCSETMFHAVEQFLRYLRLSGVEYRRVLDEFYRDGRIPCKDKREGKKQFEELKRRWI